MYLILRDDNGNRVSPRTILLPPRDDEPPAVPVAMATYNNHNHRPILYDLNTKPQQYQHAHCVVLFAADCRTGRALRDGQRSGRFVGATHDRRGRVGGGCLVVIGQQ